MKKTVTPFFLLLISVLSHAQNNIGIGTATPDPSAILELHSTQTGFLVPRMAAAQRILIANPTDALLVFDNDSGCFFYYHIQWTSLCKLSGPVGPTGATGQQGVSGIDGVTGPQGIPGNDGATGATGVQGVPGVPGSAGSNGVTGATGATGITGPLGAAGGDLTGNYPNPTVAALQGNAVSSSAPAINNLLVWNGTSWTPTDGNGLFWQITGNTGTTPTSNFIGTVDAQDLVFRTANTEWMRINAAGNVRIGTTNYNNQCGGTSNTEDAHVRLAVVGGFVSMGSYNNDPAENPSPPSTSWIGGVGALVIGMNRSAGTSNVDFWNNSDPDNGAAALGPTNRGFNFRNFQLSGGACAASLLMTLDGQGDLTLAQYSGTGGKANAYAFNTISDERVKENVTPISQPMLSRIMKLNPVSYNYLRINYEPGQKLEISKEAFPQKETGFLAQEVYRLFPEAVSKPADESKDLWAIDYSKLTVALTKAMQEQQMQIEAQQKEIDLLKELVNKK